MKVVQHTVPMITSNLLYLNHSLAKSYTNNILQMLKCTIKRNLLFKNTTKYFKTKFKLIKMQLEFN